MKTPRGADLTTPLESSHVGFLRLERTERPAPPILEIEDRHAEQKYWIVVWSRPAKYVSAFAAKFLKKAFHS